MNNFEALGLSIWTAWNSGGGCMIYDADTPEGSFSLSDETLAIYIKGITTHQYWECESEELADTLLEEYFPLSTATTIIDLHDVLSKYGIEKHILTIVTKWKEIQ